MVYYSAGRMAAPAPPAPQIYGPTSGVQSVRDGAGPQTVSVFAGTPGTDFTQLDPAASQATNLTSIANDTTGKLWWPPGVYRLTSTPTYRPEANQEHRMAKGATGTSSDTAIFKGSAVVSSWTAGTGGDAGKWFATGQTQDFTAFHASHVTNPLDHATNPVAGDELEDYYYDGVPLVAVTSKAAVTTGKKWLDRATDTVWIADDPGGHTVEGLLLYFDEGLFLVHGVSGVTIRGGIFEHSAVGIGVGLGIFNDEDNTAISDVTVRYCHQYGLASYGTPGGGALGSGVIQGFTLRRSYLHHSGKENVIQVAVNNAVWEYNHFSNGNDLHFGDRTQYEHGEGGTKSLFSFNMTYQYNWSHDHDGEDWWDTQCNNLLIKESVIEDTFRHGLFLEDNSGALVTHCALLDNGKVHSTYGVWGPFGGSRRNIYVSSNANVEISYCLFETTTAVTDTDTTPRQADVGIITVLRTYDTTGLTVHHNKFSRWAAANRRGFTSSDGNDTGACPQSWRCITRNNMFNNNEYHVPSGQVGGLWFYNSGNDSITWTDWRDDTSPFQSLDPNSTITADL